MGIKGRKNGNIEIAKELIEKYIEIGIRTKTGYSKRFLATILQAEHPDKFTDVEHARVTIRTALNAVGTNKVRFKHEDLARQFALISDSVAECVNPEPYKIPSGYNHTLVLADLHSRFCNKKNLEIAINEGVKNNCDSVIIDGDFMDYYSDSKFDKNPSIIQCFADEQEWGVDILQLLQSVFSIVYLKKGNHDIRRELHIERLSAKMPELQGLTSFEDYLFYKGSNTQIIEDYRHIVYGKLNIIHGHEYQGGGGIHVAYNRLNKAFDNVLSAHSHKGQSVIRQTINREVFGSWSISCLCNLTPRYCPKNDWTNGFAIISKDSTGSFEVENKVIYQDKIFSV